MKELSKFLKKDHIPCSHVAMEKHKPSSKPDDYLLHMICKCTAAWLELKCSTEHWSAGEGD